MDAAGKMLPVDHATQLFAATTPEFRQLLVRMEEEGSLRKYCGRLGNLAASSSPGTPPTFSPLDSEEPRYHGNAGMASFVKSLSAGLDVRQDVWVPPSGGISKQEDGSWEVREQKRSTHNFSAVVVAHNGKCAERL